ncbi:MAG: tRNA (adenosine(37)-N6)-threonylcarbamoyltransferase complex ATPase subunit type 1 TsaE [Candidatus Electryoneaceae bacterium]|nr:tRNA (adenosine(37)-N6)-threonylcarbamoyltransferase complex ATPase subunit type 1 TsaE [Candidatus Electryoneaceae bacterium]
MHHSEETTIFTRSPADTLRIGEQFGKTLQPGTVIALRGELGTGKTLFTRGICLGLGYQGDVTSPSFVRMNLYPHDPPIYHIDFYLIRNEDELFDLGLDELYGCDNIVIIEWAQRFSRFLPDDCLWIEMDWQNGEENQRKISLVGEGGQLSADMSPPTCRGGLRGG